MTGGSQSECPALPLATPDADALFADWPSHRSIALAVSGGADSMAMLLMAHDWSSRQANSPELTVFTVDHGLRAEAASEAAWVRAAAERLSLTHHVMRWQGDKPATGIQDAARQARYGMMLSFCREAGIPALATAHTADDQAETLLMRLARGSGLDGLAGIPPVSERGGVTLLRPLLGVPRARLEATLRSRGQDWIEDPSNRDPAYERVRLRAAMRGAGTDALGLAPEAVARSAWRLRRAAAALETVTADVLRHALAIHPAGLGAMPLAALLAQPEEIALRALAAMAEMFGGGGQQHGPGRDSQQQDAGQPASNRRPVRLARLEALHAGLAAGRTLPATLGGCVFRVDRGRLVAAREYGRMDHGAKPLPAGGTLLWDGRFTLTAGGAEGLSAAPLGPEGLAALREAGGRIALPARLAWTLPGLRRDGTLVYAPLATFAKGPPPYWELGARAVFVHFNRATEHAGDANSPSSRVNAVIRT